MHCRWDSFVQAAMLWSESATVFWEPTGEAGTCCKMKWSLLRVALSSPSACAGLWQQAHPECQETVFSPHLCLQLVTDVSHCSAHGHVAAAPELDISDFSDGPEQEQGKDHFANTALGWKQENSTDFILSVSFKCQVLFFLTPVRTKCCQSEAVLRRVTCLAHTLKAEKIQATRIWQRLMLWGLK